MKRALALVTLLCFCAGVGAQTPSTPPPAQQPTPSTQQPGQQAAPGQQPPPLSQYTAAGPVSLSAEPHHRLVLQNNFVHVYNVSVPPLDATLLHTHDLPYLYVTLDPSEITDAVVGQPEIHMTLQDGETRYNPGHFTHLVRTDSGLAFHNITVELPHNQGTARNLCKEVLPGQPTNCPQESASEKKSPPEANESPRAAAKRRSAEARESANNASRETGDDEVPYFETDEVRVDLRKVSSGRDYIEQAPQMHALLVALTNANLDANLGGEHIQFLHGGDVLWMPAGVHRRVVDFLGTHSSFLLILFKDSGSGASGVPAP